MTTRTNNPIEESTDKLGQDHTGNEEDCGKENGDKSTCASAASVLYSPGWKKRQFRVRVKRINKQPLFASLSQPSKNRDSGGGEKTSFVSSLALKRKNPFSLFCSSSEKRVCKRESPQEIIAPPTSPPLFEEEEEDANQEAKVSDGNETGFDFYAQSLVSSCSQANNRIDYSSSQSLPPSVDAPHNQKSTFEGSQCHQVESLPSHVLLRSKVKIVSENVLAQLKPTSHLFLPQPDPDTNKHCHWIDNCAYWIHPDIPFLKMFPRFSTSKWDKGREGISSTDSNNDAVRKCCMFAAWSNSFHSAYDLLTSGFLDLFYLCSSLMTICFHSPSSGNKPSDSKPAVRVMIVPTTRGFRDTLTKHKIKYCMSAVSSTVDKLPPPSENEVTSRVSVASGEEEEDEDESEFLQDQTSCQQWLTGLGAEQVRVSSQKSGSCSQSFEQECKLDYTKQSAITVDSAESVHLLFNFLLNFKALVSSSGQMAGIPPSIVSGRPFSGATLKQLSVKSASYKVIASGHNQGSTRHNDSRHLLEIHGGPIMPHTFNTILHKIRADLSSSNSSFQCSSTFAENTDAFSPGSAALLANFHCRDNKFFLPSETKQY